MERGRNLKTIEECCFSHWNMYLKYQQVLPDDFNPVAILCSIRLDYAITLLMWSQVIPSRPRERFMCGWKKLKISFSLNLITWILLWSGKWEFSIDIVVVTLWHCDTKPLTQEGGFFFFLFLEVKLFLVLLYFVNVLPVFSVSVLWDNTVLPKHFLN